MKLLIPADTLTEIADLGRLTNVISTINGGNRAAASNIADGIADSGYLHAVVTEVAEQVQRSTVNRAVQVLKNHGLYDIAEALISEVSGDRELAIL